MSNEAHLVRINKIKEETKIEYDKFQQWLVLKGWVLINDKYRTYQLTPHHIANEATLLEDYNLEKTNTND